MQEYNRVRQMAKGGTSVREISRRTGYHRETIGKMIVLGAPPGYRRSQEPQRPKLGPFTEIIDEILHFDQQVHRKQRHTAKRIWDRLRTEYGYAGGYTQVKDYVRKSRHLLQEVFVPLEFAPGEAQVDWGEATVLQDGIERKAHLFVLTLHTSDVRFVAAFPRATLEFFIEGHLRAFEFLQGVPRRIVYDNLKAAVIKVHRGRRRDLNKSFEKFSEHYQFACAFCNVGRGNEKGHVEGGVGWVRRNLFVPIPAVEHWKSFNEQLAEDCRKNWQERLRGHTESIGARFRQEQTHLLPIPQIGIKDDPKAQRVNSLCLVRFDTNDYSVPCCYAYHEVTVRADVGEVRVFFQDRPIAVHRRCYERERAIYEPLHYLPLIEQKPRALDYAAPMKHLLLAPCFEVLRRRLEQEQVYSRGTRAYIRILRLLEKYSLAELTRAVRRALELGVEDEEAIRNLLLCPPEKTPSRLDLTGRAHLAAYGVPTPDLSCYNPLATPGGGQ